MPLDGDQALPPPELPQPQAPPRASREERIRHPFLDGRPCDEAGNFLPPGTQPPPRTTAPPDDWSPYDDAVQFQVADFLFQKQLYEAIDATKVGDAPWQCLQTEPLAVGEDAPAWARQSYEIWYRDPDAIIANMLDNPDFDGAFDTAPYDRIYEDDPTTEGAMYTPLFFGSDKTTVSVATGDVEYHPGYMSLGNLHNTIRRGHRNGVVPFVFFAIPKSDRKYDNDPQFRTFKKQLYHSSLAAVLSSLKPGMTNPVVRRCPDGHFRRAIYDFGPFIADYPEQVMLAGSVQGWCAKCTALSKDLDGDIQGRRTHGLTDTLLGEFEADILWDEYGIDEDILLATGYWASRGSGPLG
ncbi:hypothetical protein B0H16DRAFT_1718433 [Mycena metata]|uniref:Uncharacterized protein n=1 Tax=Mycena metata TaxID=1033252 RepID=A0AAD7JH69_9AGAR|nr:hypothetical protein B0H16DRAFT_1718433 [Mycena metata]